MLNLILTCFGYILDYLRLYLTSDKDIKNTDRGACIVTVNIRSTYTKDIYISNTYVISTRIRYASIEGALL